jgi:hypothetical protein
MRLHWSFFKVAGHVTVQQIDAEQAYSICLPLSQTLKRFTKIKK